PWTLFALQLLRSGDVHHCRLHFINDRRERIRRGNWIRYRQSCRCSPWESQSLHRRDASRNDRSDQNSHRQRERDKYSREYLAAPRPIEEFSHLLSHVDYSSRPGPTAHSSQLMSVGPPHKTRRDATSEV